MGEDPADILTVLCVDVAGDVASGPRLRELVDEAGPSAVVGPPDGGGGLVAAFAWASDAAAAALRLAGEAPAGAGLHVGVATGEVRPGPGIDGPARSRADALAQLPGEAPVLLANSTAMLVLPALAPGTELVDRGVVRLGHQRAERIYELRPGGAHPGDPADDRAASNLAWACRAAAGPIVGRDDHLRRLEDAWARALTGEPQVVVVSGEPGIGKTTLAAELALRVDAEGGTVLYGRWDRTGIDPYQGVREALGCYAAVCPPDLLRADLAAHADELARLVPDLPARLGGLRPPRADDPEAERARLFDAVGDWVAAIAGRHPVLAVLDDMQWADESSLLLLRHLLDTPPAGPVLALITWRDSDPESDAPLPTLASSAAGPIGRIELGGLAAADVAALVAEALGRPLDAAESAVCAGLTADTAGNPLYVNEILAGLDLDDPVADLGAARDRLPARVHDVVGWRLSRLDPAVADVVATAALIGDEFGVDALAAALDLRPADLGPHLRAAGRAGVVRDLGERRAGFVHTVVRRALQDGIGPERAEDLHRRIALALEGRAGGGEPAPPTEVAYHWLAAADAATAETAVAWARAAADQARRETAFESSVRFLGRAVEVHDRFRGEGDRDGDRAGHDDELGCVLRLELAEAHDRTGEHTARDERHAQAAELARRLDRTDLFVRAALGYGGRLPAAPAPNPAARRLLRESLDRLPEDDSRARALTLARLAHVLHFSAPHAARQDLTTAAEAMARRLDGPVVLASVLCSQVLALDGPDDVDDQLETGAEVMRIGDRTGDDDLVLQGARARIQALFTVGAHDLARDLAVTFASLAGTVRHPDHLRLAAMWQTMWAMLAGRFDEAEAGARDLRLGLEAAGHPQALPIWLAQTCAGRWLRGDAADLLAVIEDRRRRSPADLGLWALEAWALAAGGDHAAAAAHLAGRPAADLAAADRNFTWTMTAVAAGVTATATGDRDWAAACHDALAPYRGRNCVLGWAAYLGAVDHHLGTLAAVLGRADAAADHLTAALERHRAIGARPWTALSAAWLGNTLAERDRPGDAGRAAALYGASRELAAELGLAALPPAHPRLSG